LYRIPYLTRYDLSFSTQPFARFESQVERFQLEYGAESGLNRDFTANLSLGLFNRLRRVWYSDTSAAGRIGAVQAITNSLSLNPLYDTRNDVFDPRRGLYLNSNVELAGGFLGGDNSFCRFNADFRCFQRVMLSHLLALRVTAGLALPFGRATGVPYYEEYSVGGANTLRGYGERSIGPNLVTADSSRYGDILGNANLEWRSPIVPVPTSVVKGVGGVLFADAAVLFGNQEDYAVKREYVGLAAGVGLRVNTPVGPIRLDYGKRLLDAPAGDWGKLYLGILNMF
jgi:outer membrane protein insertion porin family